jgi:hypothetical protein
VITGIDDGGKNASGEHGRVALREHRWWPSVVNVEVRRHGAARRRPAPHVRTDPDDLQPSHAGLREPPALSNASAELYVGYFANRHGDQWLFTFDRATRAAILRGGDADWGRAHAVHDGRVDDLVPAPEDAA